MRIGPWTDGDRRSGRQCCSDSRRRQSFPLSDWPQIDYGSPLGGTEPYRQSLVQFAAEDVTELLIDVDFEKGQVTSIAPDGPRIRITPGPHVAATEEPTEPGY